MNWVRQFLFRLQLPFRRRRIEAELDEEIRTHLELAAEAKQITGLGTDEARAAALREFGGVAQIKESYRDVRGFPWFEQLLQDLRFAIRSTAKAPAFAATMILTLGLGVGLCTTSFSFMNAVLHRPPPFVQSDRLVVIDRSTPQSPSGNNHSPADLRDVQTQSEVFSHFVIVDSPSYSLTVPGDLAERVSVFAVSGDYFPMMGVPPLLGRVFGLEEAKPGSSRVVVLSHQFWMRRFGGDPAVIGRPLRLDGEAATVIGVMPPQFDYAPLFGVRDMWTPLVLSPVVVDVRHGYWLNAIARLKPDVSPEQAQANLTAIAGRLAHEYPETNSQCSFRIVQLAQLMSGNGSNYLFGMVLVLSFFVLLIACANLANLQMSRNSARNREHAVRVALGSTRGRLIRQLLTESLFLSVLGGALGAFITWGNNQLYSARIAGLLGDPTFKLALDLRVLAFALVAAIIAGVVFGIAPAWLSSQVDVSGGLKQAGGLGSDRKRQWLRRFFIVGELAHTLVLVTCAGFFLLGFYRVTHRDLGWRPDHLIAGRIALNGDKFDATRQIEFQRRIVEELNATPGVERAGVCDIMPFFGFYNLRPVVAEGEAIPPPGQGIVTYINTTTPGYFATLGMTLRKGRDFTASDTAQSPHVVIVNQSLADHLWPHENPIGKRIAGNDLKEGRFWLEVVGVANDVGYMTNTVPPTPYQIYRPISQTAGTYFAVFARTAVAPETMADALRKAVARVDPDVAVYLVNSAGQAAASFTVWNHLLFEGLVCIALTALTLSAIGLYGVIANLVTERTTEIGIRVALGANSREVVWKIVSQGLRLTLLGLLLGALGAWGAATLLGKLAPGFVSTEPVVIIGSAVLLGLVAMFSCWLPARRAAGVDPMVALRTE